MAQRYRVVLAILQTLYNYEKLECKTLFVSSKLELISGNNTFSQITWRKDDHKSRANNANKFLVNLKELLSEGIISFDLSFNYFNKLTSTIISKA